MQLQSKLPDFKTSIFTIMSQLAHEENAINLSQGFPNFEPDSHLLDLVDKAMREGFNQYAPMAGIYSLREGIANKCKQQFGVYYDPAHEINVTAGATQAIYTTLTAFVQPGDEVIIFKPAYDCYEPAILASGGISIPIQMRGKDYKVDWEEFRSRLTSRTRMVVINTPHNPSGAVFSKEDMQALEASLAGTDILVLSDEVYEHIVFDNNTHISAAMLPGLRERSLICYSFGKTFHTTGWKMGYCLAPKNLMKEFQKVHEYNVFSVNHPIQKALAVYISSPEHYLDLGPFFQKKRDFFLSGLEGSSFRWTPSSGTYFQLLDYSAISDEADVEFAKRLTREYKVASIPVSVFNLKNEDRKQLRFCFAKRQDTLSKALEILQKF
ncbi:MAG: aminotransferase class I/II-fold pyridoxal phosphate-dependent enzyme [Eudoraea sp.]|nr:aminotransferase class I/II-fold pyridoxal phosphate-dependent enzyme [Eudoraea sp.]